MHNLFSYQEATVAPIVFVVNKVETCHHQNLYTMGFLRKSAKMDYILTHARISVVPRDEDIYKEFKQRLCVQRRACR